MIVENANVILMKALTRSGCFMYDTPTVPFSIPIDRILAIYGDKIAVYNADKALLLPYPTQIGVFDVVHIDEYNHIFTKPVDIWDKLIEMIKINDPNILNMVSSDIVEVVSLALRRLKHASIMSPDVVPPNYMMMSSCNQMPDPIIEAIEAIPEEHRDEHMAHPPINAKSFFPVDYPYDYLIPHQASVESLQMIFEPEGVSDQCRRAAGYGPDVLSPSEIILENNPTAFFSATSNPKYDQRYSIQPPSYVANMKLFPDLNKLEEDQQQPVEFTQHEIPQSPNSLIKPYPVHEQILPIVMNNPIGFIETKKQDKKKKG